jgi:hypothetical protein
MRMLKPSRVYLHRERLLPQVVVRLDNHRVQIPCLRTHTSVARCLFHVARCMLAAAGCILLVALLLLSVADLTPARRWAHCRTFASRPQSQCSPAAAVCALRLTRTAHSLRLSRLYWLTTPFAPWVSGTVCRQPSQRLPPRRCAVTTHCAASQWNEIIGGSRDSRVRGRCRWIPTATVARR